MRSTFFSSLAAVALVTLALSTSSCSAAATAAANTGPDKEPEINSNDGDLNVQVPVDKDITFERFRRESVSVWTLNEKVNANEGKIDGLSATLGDMEAVMDQKVSTNLDAAVRVLSATITSVTNSFESRMLGLTNIVTDVAENSMSNLTDLINEFTAEAAVQSRAQQTQFESLKNSINTQMSSLKNNINAQMAGFGKQVDAKISAQAAKDAAARKAIVDNLGKLMYQGDIDKYLVTTWQSSSYHSNRKYFKIKFNPNRPGYFSCGSAEFRTACTALNTALRGSDGVDRALKPVCNHQSYTDGNCVRLSGSYLSHCKCFLYICVIFLR